MYKGPSWEGGHHTPPGTFLTLNYTFQMETWRHRSGVQGEAKLDTEWPQFKT